METNKHTAISPMLGCRIAALLEASPTVSSTTTGPKDDPYTKLVAYFDPESALGRFLASKGYVNGDLSFALPDCHCFISVDERIVGRTTRLRVTATAIA
jgi:hypothetical protein